MKQLDLFTVDLDAFLKQTLGELETLGIDPKEFAIRFLARQIAQRLEALPSADQVMNGDKPKFTLYKKC